MPKSHENPHASQDGYILPFFNTTVPVFFKNLLLFFCMLVILAHGLYWLVGPHLTASSNQRVRFDVEVQTPHGVRSGHGVLEVQRFAYSWRQVRTVVRVKGEAIPVDLDDGRTLYMLIGDPWARGVPWVSDYFAQEYHDGLPAFIIRNSRVAYKGEPPQNVLQEMVYPDFAYFKDPKDPSSIREVKAKYPEKALGPGYLIKSITVRRSEEPITSEIEKRLPWLRDWEGNMLGKKEGDLLYFPSKVKATFFRRSK